MRIEIKEVYLTKDLENVFRIRKEVFVEEQKVDEREEYEFEEESHHFLAFLNSIPVGTARWRITDLGIKLERFAVLKEFRGMGVGSALVKFVLEHLPKEPHYVYLNAQLTAMNLYQKFGFHEVGYPFQEAGIQHYKMVIDR